jgi:dsRNA-specific ribonuclease
MTTQERHSPSSGSSSATLGKNILNDTDIVLAEDGHGYIFNPYNPDNREITLNDVQSILSTYGVPSKLHNFELYRRAFIHASYTKRPQLENARENIKITPQPPNCMALRTKSNERLEFLGDGVLECVTKYYLYRRFPKENEGFMTEKKIAIVKNESIGKLALEMGLHKWFIISKHAEEKKTRTNLKKLGCLFEAFIGALFLDFNKISVHDDEKWFESVFVTGPGFQMAQKFIEAVFERHIDWISLIKNDDNYKNILQVKIQKEFKTTPDYLEIQHDAETGYTMGVFLCLGKEIYHVDSKCAINYSELKSFAKIREIYEERGHILVHFASGTHKIKKKAEQMACELAIQCM